MSYADEREFIAWAIKLGAVRIRIGEIELTVPPQAPTIPEETKPTDPAKLVEMADRIKFWSA